MFAKTVKAVNLMNGLINTHKWTIDKQKKMLGLEVSIFLRRIEAGFRQGLALRFQSG